jgi:hypothetical protein
MTDPLGWLKGLIGTWAGAGDLEDGTGTQIRLDITSAVEGHALCIHLEAFLPSTQLVHGARLIVGPGPDGALQCMAYSTMYGMITLEPTPDDERVLALAGRSVDGTPLGFSLLAESEDTLVLTAIPRRDERKPNEVVRRGTHARLHRRAAWKPPKP